jgi:hypothetical protein
MAPVTLRPVKWLALVAALALAGCSSSANTAARQTPVPSNVPLSSVTATTLPPATCAAVADAARAAAAVTYANNPLAYPATFDDMMVGEVKALELPAGVVKFMPTVLQGAGWMLTMTAGASVLPTFTCS